MSLRRLPWKQFSVDPRVEHHRDLRASDSDRTLVLDALGDAFTHGEIDRGELEDRTRSALDAETLGQCLCLLTDLVPMDKPRSSPVRPRERSLSHGDLVVTPLTYVRVSTAAGVAPIMTYVVVRALGGMSGGWDPPTLFWIVSAILAAHAALAVAGHRVYTNVIGRPRPRLEPGNT